MTTRTGAVHLLLATLLWLPIGPLLAEEDESRLTLERIHDEKEFSEESFDASWLKTGPSYTTLEKSELVPHGQDIVLHDAATGTSKTLVPAGQLIPTDEERPLSIDSYQLSENLSRLLIYTNSKRVWRRNTRGDYWVLDRTSHELRQLGGDAKPSSLMFATFSPDGRKVAYVRENDVYVEDLVQPGITRLTRRRSEHIINGTTDWVYEEELGLRNGIRWSPDSRKLAFWEIDTEGVREFPLVNFSAGLYPEVKTFAYPKVGQRNSQCRVGVIDADGGEVTWLRVPGDSRDHYIARMDWAEGSDDVLIQQLNRLQNTNRLMLANASSGTVQEILVERDDAWVDVHDELVWLGDGSRFLWMSERDGWLHLYVVPRSGGSPKLITPGEFDVISVAAVDESRGSVYFIASPKNASQRYLYMVSLEGGEAQRVTPVEMAGTHSYSISSDGNWAIHTQSSFGDVPVIDLVSLPEHRSVRVLIQNKGLRKKVQQLDRTPGEFFRVNIGEGVELDAWCVKPPKMDEKKKYPLLVYVYGEPAGQTVLDRWGGRHHLWHMMLAQRGYVVMSFDNRGTASPRGREWRKSIYRQVGILAPEEQAKAVRQVLADRPYLDPDRVGVWGWSGGGSMTLNAMFKHPDLYKTGISVAPVPNQRYYDTIYQERYMGLPDDNVVGFHDGSPINFAHQLKGNLLLIHGTGDDNCHYQGTEALINVLIQHNKPFRMMAYPNRTHSIREGLNTTLHLRSLMTRYLEETLPPNGKDAKPR